MTDLLKLKHDIEPTYNEIIDEVIIKEINEMRIILKDNSFIDVWFSLKLPDRYSYHWERRFIDGALYRHDNIPHRKWRSVKTFPKHYHNGSAGNVTESTINSNIEIGLHEFLEFVKRKLG